MATLDNADFTRIKQWVKQHPSINTDFEAWGLSKAQWHGALQAVEDYQVAAVSTQPSATLRATVEAHTGATTLQRVGNVLAVWAAWKAVDYTGG